MKKAFLIIDGNLLARKSFYKFKVLSSKMKVSELGILSKHLMSNIISSELGEALEEEIVNKDNGDIFTTKEGISSSKLRKIRTLEQMVTINTGILYGVLRSILSVSEEMSIEKIIFCYDPIKVECSLTSAHQIITPHRIEISPEYKNRKKDPETEKIFHEGLSLLQSFLHKSGFKQAVTTKFEADDLMQYFSKKVFKKNKCIILTEDHDMFQLLEGNRVVMLNIGKRRGIVTEKDFIRKYKIPPNKYRDVLVLGGCSTDKVKGLKGVGEDTALEAIQTFESLETLLKTYRQNKDKVSKRMFNALERDRKNKFTEIQEAYRLVRLYGLKKQLRKDTTITKINISKEGAYNNAINMLKTLKFKSLLNIDQKKSLKAMIFKQFS